MLMQSEAGTHQLTGPASWHSTSSSHLGLQYPISEGHYLPTMFTIKFPANMSSKEMEDSSNGSVVGTHVGNQEGVCGS